MNAQEEALDRIFFESLALPVRQRAAFVHRACDDDVRLRERVQRLLRADAKAGAFVEPTLPPVQGEGLPVAQIGRYQVVEKIGEGGIGEVFKAEQRPKIL